MSNLTSLGKIHGPSSSNINLNFFLTRKGVISGIFNLGSFIESYIKLIFKEDKEELLC